MSLIPVPVLDAESGKMLCDRFRQLGITRDFLRQLSEGEDNLRSPLQPTREALFRDDASAVVFRLFFCGKSLPKEEAAQALTAPLWNRLAQQRLLQVNEQNGVRDRWPATCHLRTVRGLYLFSDYLVSNGPGATADAVMGAGQTTTLLYHASETGHRKKRVLDLGCGAGSLALLFHSSADHVVATDINARAIAFCELNASVNGIGNVEFRVGSLFEPVAGEQFDLIISQPPYYPAPGDLTDSLVYLHGGTLGDELALQILQDIERYLTQDGQAVVFTSWATSRIKTAPEGLRVFELTANQSEVTSTHQSINVIERHAGEGRWTTFPVPADDWARVSAARIAELLACHRLAEASDEDLLKSTLRLPEGVDVIREAGDVFLRFPPGLLIGWAPVDENVVRLLEFIHSSRNVAVTGNAKRYLATACPVILCGFLLLKTFAGETKPMQEEEE